MYLIFIVLLVSLFSCSSHEPQQSSIPVFSKEVVCSANSIKYFNGQKNSKLPSPYENEELNKYMLGLTPFVRACFEDEMKRTDQKNHFNLCLIVGVDREGNNDFLNFQPPRL